jgi:hypothetical protein
MNKRRSKNYICINMPKPLLHRLNNKYFITILIFGVWMLFFDNNNFIAQFRLSRYYLSEIQKDRQACYELRTDTLTLEKFGREQYLMKRDNEDIYLIVDGDE